MKTIYNLVFFFLMLSFTAKAQISDIELSTIKKVGYNKYTIDGKDYLGSDLEKLIIKNHKYDPLYEDIISHKNQVNAVAILGLAVSIPIIIYAAKEINSNGKNFTGGRELDSGAIVYFGLGVLGLVLSVNNLKKSQWVISDLPKAINLWNENIEQYHSFVPYTSIGVTSHGVGLIHTF